MKKGIDASKWQDAIKYKNLLSNSNLKGGDSQ